MKVLIDCGHGIDTPGKRSPDGLFREYKWNREIGDLVMEKLTSRGVDADLVVKETNDISLRTRATRVNKVCRSIGASNVLLVSIHANAAGNGSRWMTATGWECYTSPGKTRSDEVAECMYDAFGTLFPEKKIRKDMSDGDRDKEASFYIIAKTLCPAVLLENFFYDNREECAWLLKDYTKERVATAITIGILKYIKK